MSIPISHSERLRYHIRHQISTYAEEMIEHTQSCRPAAFLDVGASQLTSLVLRVFTVGELTIRGLGLIGSSDSQLGKAMLKKACIQASLKIPLNVLSLIIKPIIIALESNPKFWIMWGLESAKVNLKHAEKGTIGSKEHEHKLNMTYGKAIKREREWARKRENAAGLPNATSISHSERLDYCIQYKIFNYINEITEPGQRLRPPAFLALGVSNTTFFILRVFAVGELTIRGLGLIYSDYPLGKAMLKRVPVQVLQATVGLAVSTIVNSYRIIKEPKGYILNNLEQTQIDIQHAETGTFDSENYQSDLQVARGRAAATLREWQLVHEL
ncbi:MAG: hypothetical protein ACRDAI_06640 [Candidatus Rhabdochlamydia sp.]